MSLWNDLRGVMSSLLGIGGTNGVNLKHNSGSLEVKNNDDSEFATLRAKHLASGGSIDDVPTLLDLKGRIAILDFNFSGGSAPSPGTNTGKFGFCHTTGGSYTAGDIVYDDGTTTLSSFKVPFATHVTTKTAISGTISMIANGIYANEAGTWVLKGDGAGSGTGNVQLIELSITSASGNVDSTTALPNGARVLSVDVDVTTAFDGTSPTVAVSAQGSTPVTLHGTTQNNLKVVNQYKSQSIVYIGPTGAGVIRAAVTPSSSTVGAAKIIVIYVTASNA